MKITHKSERKSKQLLDPVAKNPTKLKGTGKKMEYNNQTPEGEKPNLDEFPNEYNPPRVDCAWYSWWLKQGLFKPKGTGDKKFVMIMPPPNITGELHIGHALPCSISDALIRYHRMIGDDTLWIPGVDHAGISTQVKVEKMLKAEKNLSRHDLTRDEFLSYANEWTEEYMAKIHKQIYRLGCSCDWNENYFTLDEKCSRAVKEAFCKLFNKGKIYRCERLVNWDCALQTAISDAEVEYKTLTHREMISVPNHQHKEYPFGIITYFKYPIADDEGNPTKETITIATTRLETILGDEAVAINSKDPRYFHLHGKRVYNYFRKKTLPIIIDDELADMDFGTGAVKVTPAHDPNDFETGLRHKLPFTNIFTEDGKINDISPEFEGMPRFDARIKIAEQLKKLQLFDHEEDHEMRLGITQRGHDINEQIIKKQWFIDTKEMAERAIKVLDDGQLEIFPAEFKTDWKIWHENIRPWCISRQLWWGHRIPAYQIFIDGKAQDNTNGWVAAHDDEEAFKLASEKVGIFDKNRIKIIQDEDVLDTWFSAALLPFSSLGWPDIKDNIKFDRYFPGSSLQTGFDILTFWLSRMVMLSLELTDQIPFKTILLNPLIRDAQGRKMSKSLGNVVNFNHIIDGISLQELIDNLKYSYLDEKEMKIAEKGMRFSFPNGILQLGTDAMRMAFISFACTGRKVNLNMNQIISYRNFCNKMWNATKYAMPKFINLDTSHDTLDNIDDDELSIADKWILNKLNIAIKAAILGCEEYLMGKAISSLIHFFHDEFCSIYLETIKPIMNSDDERKKKIITIILYECIETTLRLFHPFMPFITEDLWQRIPKRFDCPSIMISPYPRENIKWDSYSTIKMENAIKITSSIRKMAHTYNIGINKISAQIATDISDISDTFETICAMTGIKNIEQIPRGSPANPGFTIEILSESLEVRIDLTGLIDFEKEYSNAESKKQKIVIMIKKLEDKMKDPNREEKVPQNIIDAEREKLDSYIEQINALEAIQRNLKAAMGS